MSTMTVIPPGSTSRSAEILNFTSVDIDKNNRIILPLKRMILPEEVTSSPIPTLSERQFVVAKDRLSEVELQLQRELFWHREALFKSIHGHWKEVRQSE